MDLQKTLAFLEEVEGFRSEPYLDNKGVPTIGIGTVYYSDGSKVTMQDHECTREQAESWATERIEKDSQEILNACLPFVPNDNQLIALLSFSYNEGLHALKTSSLLHFLITGHPDLAALEFAKWNKITVNGEKVEDKGLSNRRAKEKALFLQA